MLGFAVQPPLQGRPGIALYPPVVARLYSETNIFEQLSQIWAVASLLSYSGETLYDQLHGKIADSAHPLANTEQSTGSSSSAGTDRAYFYFPGLIILEPGRYRIRISFMQMDFVEGVARVQESIDSRSIMIEERLHSMSRPSE